MVSENFVRKCEEMDSNGLFLLLFVDFGASLNERVSSHNKENVSFILG